MNFSNKAKQDDTVVDLTPLIDVVFLLLIFFMVSTTFKAESKIVVDLPTSSDRSTSAIESVVELSLDRNGIIEYKGSILTIDELGDVLAAVTQGDKAKPILVRADQDVTHGTVVRVIDKARQNGFDRISVATRAIPSSN